MRRFQGIGAPGRLLASSTRSHLDFQSQRLYRVTARSSRRVPSVVRLDQEEVGVQKPLDEVGVHRSAIVKVQTSLLIKGKGNTYSSAALTKVRARVR